MKGLLSGAGFQADCKAPQLARTPIAPTAHMLLLRGAGEMNGGQVERWSGIGGDGESLDGLTGDLSDDLKVLIEM